MTKGSPNRDDYISTVMDTIDEYGVMIQAVFSGEGQEPSPSFAYTVGLAAIGEPEIIVFGLSPETSHHILNSMALPLGERAWQPGISHEVFGLDVPAYLLVVADSSEHLTVSNMLFGGADPIPALQLVYPDKNGRWPWEPGCLVADSQPLLGSKP